MKVSIIIPCTTEYMKFYQQAVDSVKEQTRLAEIVTVQADDMSVGLATNEGVRRAQGDYVMRLDCDDYLHPYAVQIMLNHLETAPNIVAVYSDYWHADENGHTSIVGHQNVPPHPGCMMIRKWAFDTVGGFYNLPRQEGTDFYYRLTKHHEVNHIPLPLWYYRRHREQMSNAHNEVVKARHEVKEQHQKQTEKILAIIPARGGSKGIPRKNLIKLDGLPLVVHAIRMAKSSKHDILIAVSTEDKEIREVAEAEGVSVIHRPPGEAGDEVNLITVAKSAMITVGATFAADIVVTIQPTAPWTPVEALDCGLSRMLKDPSLDAVVSMSEIIGRHPYRLYKQINAWPNLYQPFFPDVAEAFLQRQDRPKAFQFTGGFYCRRRHLLENWSGDGFALGSWEGIEVPTKAGIDIDTRFDLWLAEAVKEHWSEL